MKGYVIVIEGTDGSGKQTQTNKLVDKMLSSNLNVIKQSFPNYQSASSGPVKMYLGGELGEHANSLDAYQASIFFAADRLCTFSQLKQHYDNGGIIVFDRYVSSNMVHQAGKITDLKERDAYLNWLDNLEYNLCKLPRPDKVFFLDVPVAVSKKLANERADLKTGKKKDIHEEDANHLKNAYDAGKYVAKKYNWDVIPCVNQQQELKSVEEIHNEICKRCADIMQNANFLNNEIKR